MKHPTTITDPSFSKKIKIKNKNKGERERERQRDRDRQTQRQIHRDRERHRERDTERERQTQRLRDRDTDRHRDRDRQTQRQRDRVTETDRHRDRQTQRQRHRERERHTHTHTEEESVQSVVTSRPLAVTDTQGSVMMRKAPTVQQMRHSSTSPRGLHPEERSGGRGKGLFPAQGSRRPSLHPLDAAKAKKLQGGEASTALSSGFPVLREELFGVF